MRPHIKYIDSEVFFPTATQYRPKNRIVERVFYLKNLKKNS